MRTPTVGLVFVGMALCGSPVLAQAPDTLEAALPEIEIEAARASESEATAPFAVSILRRAPDAVALEPGLSLESVLRGLPGVWINDRGHDALGERLVIRGMGWRAAFGVRGVQALLDGIPMTLPDGQSVLDVADPAFIRQAEVVRGPASLFWGNGSGGVLFLSTAAADTAFARLRALGGSYGLRQVGAEAALPVGRHRLYGFASDVRRDGYRAHSAGRFTRAGLHGGFDLGARTRVHLTAAFADQDAQNPGALTQAQVQADPRQADPRTVETRAGKLSRQAQAGLTLRHQTPFGLFSATVYGLVRDLDNPLTFAYIRLDRLVGGARVQVQHRAGRFAWGLGADVGRQRDDRRNLDNDGGRPGDALSLHQREVVRNVAAFGYLTHTLAAHVDVTAGGRFDAIHFSMQDYLQSDGDASGARTFSAFSPALGLSYRRGNVLFFANVSTAFETPTTTELVNRPDGAGGFNPDLEPQRTRGFEGGARGAWPAARLRFDATLFRLSIRDRLLPFQGDDGRTFFRNAGRNTHDGLELSARWQALAAVEAHVAYTGSRFVFDDQTLRDHRIPGVPAHHLSAGLRLARGGFRVHLVLEAATDAYADDANTAQNEGYVVLDLNVGHTGLRLGRALAQPLVRLSNVFDARYNGSVVVNAFGGRFFEPAAGRTVQAGVNVAFY